MGITPGTWVAQAVARAVMLALLVTSVPAAYAAPTTPEIERQRELAAVAAAELEELAALAELRHEEYEQIAAALAATRADITQTRERVNAAALELAAAHDSLEDRASGIYRSGGVDFLEVVIGTRSFQELLTRIEWFRRVSQNDAALVSHVRAAKEELEAAEKALERRQEEQVTLRRQADAKRSEVEAALARQDRYVRELDAEITRLVAAEEERLRREAEERARIAAERARAAEEAARRAAEQSGGARGGDGRVAAPNTRTFDPSALGTGNPGAVSAGMNYLGVPYVWGGSTPAGFDCSGLTQRAYGDIGISIPRNSRSQYTVGAYIPPDRLDLLVPGDLVFFGYGGDPNRVHHVGIFVGGGDYLHAPFTGASVRVDSLTDRIDRRSDYVGATRP